VAGDFSAVVKQTSIIGIPKCCVQSVKWHRLLFEELKELTFLKIICRNQSFERSEGMVRKKERRVDICFEVPQVVERDESKSEKDNRSL
jgi:hypothetical protein